MAAESLRDELMGIPGVIAADFEGNAENPDGVKVRLDAGVDVEAVGEEIQRVLTEHGLRSELAGREGTEPPSVEEAAAEPIAGVATATADQPEPAAEEDAEADLASAEAGAPEPVIILDSVRAAGPQPVTPTDLVPGESPSLPCGSLRVPRTI